MHAEPRSDERSRGRWPVAAAAFAAGICVGFLVARLSSESRPDDDAPRVEAAGGVRGTSGASDGSPAAARSSGAQRARPPEKDPAARAFPNLRWREPSHGPPPPPESAASAPSATDTAAPKSPPSVEASLALLAAAARGKADPAKDEVTSVMCAAVAVANATPLPSIPLDVLRGIAVRFPASDVAGVLLPCLDAGAAAEELAVLLGGGGAWGSDHARDIWTIRLATRAAEAGHLPEGAIDRLLAWPRPWVRAAAVNLAADHSPLDRGRLGELAQEDPDVDVRTAAFCRYVESTEEGQEPETLAFVRRMVWSPDRLGETAVAALPGLGAGAVPIARELVAAGGLDGGEVRDVAATLLGGGEPDALIPLARAGTWNDEILDAIDDRVLEHEEERAACAALVRALAIPRASSAAESHCQRIANLELFEIVAEIARSAEASPEARVAAIDEIAGRDGHLDEGLSLAVEALGDKDADVRRLTLEELGERLAESSPERAALVRALVERDPSPSVRRAAAGALRRAE